MPNSTSNNRLVLLGTKGGPAVRKPNAMPSSSMLQMDGSTFIIDCGVGVTRAIAKAGASILDVNAIFITHLHSDHLLELGPLLHTMWTSGLSKPVEIYGPDGLELYLAHFLKSMEFDNNIRVEDEGRTPLEDLIELHIYGEGRVIEKPNLSVMALRVKHPPVDECYALKFEGKTDTVVFSADTAYFPPLADFAKDTDILVHEAMLMEGVEAILANTKNASRLREHLIASHSTVEEAAKIANDSEAKHLVLNHLIPADMDRFSRDDFKQEAKKTFTGKISIGFDGMVIALN